MIHNISVRIWVTFTRLVEWTHRHDEEAQATVDEVSLILMTEHLPYVIGISSGGAH